MPKPRKGYKMAEDKDEDDDLFDTSDKASMGEDADDDDLDEEVEEDEEVEMAEDMEGDGEDGGEMTDEELQANMLETLALHGIEVPSDINFDNPRDLMMGVYIAAHSANAAKESADVDEGADLGDELPPEAEEGAMEEMPEAGAMMSRRNGTGKKPQQPKKPKAQLSQREQQMQARMSKMAKVAGDSKFSLLNGKIKELLRTGRVEPVVARQWRDVLDNRRLSLATGDSPAVNKVLAQMEYALNLPAESVVKLSQASGVEEKPVGETNTQGMIDYIAGKKLSHTE